MACVLMKSGSVRWKLLCCVRCWWLENRRWRPSTAQRLAVDVIHQCRQHGENLYHPWKSECLSLFGLPEPFQNCSLSEARETTGRHNSVPLSGFEGHLQVSAIPGAKDWFALGCVWASHCVGEHQGRNYPVLILEGNYNKARNYMS